MQHVGNSGHEFSCRSQGQPIKMLIAHPPGLSHILPQLSIPPSKAALESGGSSSSKKGPTSQPLKEFLEHVEHQFKAPLQKKHLKSAAAKLKAQFKDKLDGSDLCMLPSYQDSLPNGNEKGTYIALDVGGSGLRAAWVQLYGRVAGKADSVQIYKLMDFTIDETVRALEGRAFFDWMADRISDTLAAVGEVVPEPISVGLAWSFPVQQESKRDALLMQMGKDFRACNNLIGYNLGDLLEESCHKKGSNVKVRAVVNDGAASLLSQIYVDGTTSMAVILGTGLNAAIHLPSNALSPEKFSTSGSSTPINAPPSPNVLVNTELSLFGKNVLDTTPWDETLNLSHTRPDFQPLEYLTSGRYLGEIVRLILVRAIQEAKLFDGEMPLNFEPYSLETSTLAYLEGDNSYALFKGGAVFSARHPLPSNRSYLREDLVWVRKVISLVTNRAAAYMGTAIYALWSLKQESEGRTGTEQLQSASISCLGSILGKYPQFRDRVQEWLDELLELDTESESHQSLRPHVQLEMTSEREGALIGAAVAVAVSEQGPDAAD